ncbi:hypothetical protein TNCV_1228561 [Trichonephila clavipes]|nr:hypothetical protein TNCV_1228561 [Trichonephila clavipes]
MSAFGDRLPNFEPRPSEDGDTWGGLFPLHIFTPLQRETASQVAEIANGVYGADTVTANYVQFWFRRFGLGIFDIKYAPRTGVADAWPNTKFGYLLTTTGPLEASDSPEMARIGQQKRCCVPSG